MKLTTALKYLRVIYRFCISWGSFSLPFLNSQQVSTQVHHHSCTPIIVQLLASCYCLSEMGLGGNIQ